MKTLAYLFIAASLLFSLFTISRILFTFHLGDFETYYVAVQQVLQGKNPYHQLPSQFAFIYPPASFFFLLPLIFLPFHLAEKLWTLVSVGSLIGPIACLLKTVSKKVTLFSFLLLFSFSMIAFPTKFTLGMGEINLIICLLLSLTFFYWRQNQPFLGGLMLSIATTIKLTPAFALVFFLKKRAFKLTTVCLGLSLSLMLLAIFVFGPQLTHQYFLKVLPAIPTIGNQAYYNQALSGFLARSGIPSFLALIINYLALIGLLLISLLLTKTKKQSVLTELSQYGLIITVVLIAGGLAWQHHLVLLIIPYTALFLSLKRTRQKKTPAFLALLSYLLVAINIKNPQHFFGVTRLFLSHGLYGMILLFVLLIQSFSIRDR